jgi:hypothetical protein
MRRGFSLSKGLPGARHPGSTILKKYLPPIWKQTFFFLPSAVSTSSPTATPGILDASFAFCRFFNAIASPLHDMNPDYATAIYCGPKNPAATLVSQF